MIRRIVPAAVLSAVALAGFAPAPASAAPGRVRVPNDLRNPFALGDFRAMAAAELAPRVGDTVDVPARPAPSADAFGVTMLYPTKAGGETWSLADDALADPRFDPQNEITRNEDGSWKMRSDKVRMSVRTSTGYDASALETDHGVLAERGYMQAPNDWKNVEMTGYVKVNETPGVDNFAWYARGGKHGDANPCEGSSYKGGLHYDGRARVEKETWHVSYDQGTYETATSSIVGRWVGFKTVMHNVEVNGAPAVKIELWLDDAGDGTSWAKVNEMIDDGSVGGDGGACGAADPAQPLTWGGPLAVFRWDTATDVDFKWLSVREIE